MSLVNDMLRDLDARRASGGSDLGVIEPSPAPSHGWQTLALCLVAVLLMVTSALAYRWFMAERNSSSAPSAAAALVDQSVANDRSAAKEPDFAAPEPVVETQEVVDAPVAEVSQHAAVTLAVQPLLTAAAEALAENRLTQPPVNNAYALYRHVLLLDPNNAEALTGITQVQARYDELVRNAIMHREWDTAQRYLTRAEAVATPADRLASLAQQLEQARAKVTSASETQIPKEEPEQHAQEQKPAEATGSGVVGSQPQSEASSRITLSWRSEEAAAVTKAKSLRQQGRLAEAIAVLQPLVASEPRAESAALALFDIYLETGDAAGAQAQIAHTRDTHLNRFYGARLMVDSGQADQALQVLEQGDPRGAVRQPYLALQAALHQRAAQYPQALRLYQQLVELDNREPSYWLGMGVAAEASGQTAQALRAFAAADQLGTTNPAVSSYIKQRIEALSQ